MALSIDDFARLDDEAGQWVADVWGRCVEDYLQPEIERREVSEYDALTPEQHAAVMSAQGEDNYGAWATEMERLRQKHGGTNASRMG